MTNKKFSIENFYKLKNKKIIITGSSGQLGSELVKAFIDFGSIVIGIDVKKSKNFSHKNFYFIKADISNSSKNKAIFQKIFKKFKNISCLINNAGVAVFSPFEKRSEKELDYVIDVNLKSYFYSIKNFEKYSNNNNKKENKNIINISSIYSLISPDPKIYSKNDRKSSEIYGMTKSAVNQLTKYFAVHLAKKYKSKLCFPRRYLKWKTSKRNFIKKYSKKSMNRMAETFEIVGGVIYLAQIVQLY